MKLTKNQGWVLMRGQFGRREPEYSLLKGWTGRLKQRLKFYKNDSEEYRKDILLAIDDKQKLTDSRFEESIVAAKEKKNCRTR